MWICLKTTGSSSTAVLGFVDICLNWDFEDGLMIGSPNRIRLHVEEDHAVLPARGVSDRFRMGFGQLLRIGARVEHLPILVRCSIM